MVRCWRTLMACCRDPVEAVVHDDGSLTEEDESRIGEALPGSRILWRRDADAVMAETLARHPAARAFRDGSIWGLKLLDVALAEKGDCFYLDADVRFFRPFQGLFRRDALAGRSVFLRDTVWTAYSIRPWHLLDRRGLKVVEGINTGLACIDRTLYPLDFVEWFLSQPDWRVIPAWTEPTCWAAVAYRANGHAADPADLLNLYPGARLGRDTVGAHFLSAHRPLFQRELEAPVPAGGEVAEIRMKPLARLGPLALGLNQWKRKVGNTRALRERR
jgi:hypothetical protein